MTKNINARIAAEISWARTSDRSARTRPAREGFLKSFEREVDPDGKLPIEERRRRAEHALRAHMLRLRKRATAGRKGTSTKPADPQGDLDHRTYTTTAHKSGTNHGLPTANEALLASYQQELNLLSTDGRQWSAAKVTRLCFHC